MASLSDAELSALKAVNLPLYVSLLENKVTMLQQETSTYKSLLLSSATATSTANTVQDNTQQQSTPQSSPQQGTSNDLNPTTSNQQNDIVQLESELAQKNEALQQANNTIQQLQQQVNSLQNDYNALSNQYHISIKQADYESDLLLTTNTQLNHIVSTLRGYLYKLSLTSTKLINIMQTRDSIDKNLAINQKQLNLFEQHQQQNDITTDGAQQQHHDMVSVVKSLKTQQKQINKLVTSNVDELTQIITFIANNDALTEQISDLSMKINTFNHNSNTNQQGNGFSTANSVTSNSADVTTITCGQNKSSSIPQQQNGDLTATPGVFGTTNGAIKNNNNNINPSTVSSAVDINNNEQSAGTTYGSIFKSLFGGLFYNDTQTTGTERAEDITPSEDHIAEIKKRREMRNNNNNLVSTNNNNNNNNNQPQYDINNPNNQVVNTTQTPKKSGVQDSTEKVRTSDVVNTQQQQQQSATLLPTSSSNNATNDNASKLATPSSALPNNSSAPTLTTTAANNSSVDDNNNNNINITTPKKTDNVTTTSTNNNSTSTATKSTTNGSTESTHTDDIEDYEGDEDSQSSDSAQGASDGNFEKTLEMILDTLGPTALYSYISPDIANDLYFKHNLRKLKSGLHQKTISTEEEWQLLNETNKFILNSLNKTFLATNTSLLDDDLDIFDALVVNGQGSEGFCIAAAPITVSPDKTANNQNKSVAVDNNNQQNVPYNSNDDDTLSVNESVALQNNDTTALLLQRSTSTTTLSRYSSGGYNNNNTTQQSTTHGNTTTDGNLNNKNTQTLLGGAQNNKSYDPFSEIATDEVLSINSMTNSQSHDEYINNLNQDIQQNVYLLPSKKAVKRLQLLKQQAQQQQQLLQQQQLIDAQLILQQQQQQQQNNNNNSSSIGTNGGNALNFAIDDGELLKQQLLLQQQIKNTAANIAALTTPSAATQAALFSPVAAAGKGKAGGFALGGGVPGRLGLNSNNNPTSIATKFFGDDDEEYNNDNDMQNTLNNINTSNNNGTNIAGTYTAFDTNNYNSNNNNNNNTTSNHNTPIATSPTVNNNNTINASDDMLMNKSIQHALQQHQQQSTYNTNNNNNNNVQFSQLKPPQIDKRLPPHEQAQQQREFISQLQQQYDKQQVQSQFYKNATDPYERLLPPPETPEEIQNYKIMYQSLEQQRKQRDEEEYKRKKKEWMLQQGIKIPDELLDEPPSYLEEQLHSHLGQQQFEPSVDLVQFFTGVNQDSLEFKLKLKAIEWRDQQDQKFFQEKFITKVSGVVLKEFVTNMDSYKERFEEHVEKLKSGLTPGSPEYQKLSNPDYLKSLYEYKFRHDIDKEMTQRLHDGMFQVLLSDQYNDYHKEQAAEILEKQIRLKHTLDGGIHVLTPDNDPELANSSGRSSKNNALAPKFESCFNNDKARKEMERVLKQREQRLKKEAVKALYQQHQQGKGLVHTFMDFVQTSLGTK